LLNRLNTLSKLASGKSKYGYTDEDVQQIRTTLINKENRHCFAKKIDGRTCRLVAIPAAELYDGGVGF